MTRSNVEPAAPTEEIDYYLLAARLSLDLVAFSARAPFTGWGATSLLDMMAPQPSDPSNNQHYRHLLASSTAVGVAIGVPVGITKGSWQDGVVTTGIVTAQNGLGRFRFTERRDRTATGSGTWAACDRRPRAGGTGSTTSTGSRGAATAPVTASSSAGRRR